MKELWVDKYRPRNLSTYVFKDASQKRQVEGWLKSGAIPHLLFSGSAGTGKTTLAKVLLNELGADPSDVLEINASSENSVDDVRNKIYNFVSTMSFGGFKYVLLDEVDHFSHSAQAALRNLIENSSSTARFILTCNYPNKIMSALHSRCSGFHIETLDKVEFTAGVAQILIGEGVEFELEVLDTFVSATYPDMRKCINLLQTNSLGGTLQKPSDDDKGTADYKLEAVSLFKKRDYLTARKLICAQIAQNEYEDMFRFMYQNLELWAGNDIDKESEAIIIIRNGLVKHASVADLEINLSATLCELELLAKR